MNEPKPGTILISKVQSNKRDAYVRIRIGERGTCRELVAEMSLEALARALMGEYGVECQIIRDGAPPAEDQP